MAWFYYVSEHTHYFNIKVYKHRILITDTNQKIELILQYT